MPESTQPSESPVAESFRAHLQAFYDGLPPEEQTLLEQVVALGSGAAADQGDVQGFSWGLGATALLVTKIDVLQQPNSGSPL